MPPNPPPAATATHPPLKKFTLHPPSLTAPTSPLTLCLNTTGALPNTTLAVLRTTLLSSRALATDRISIRDANRRNINDRQASDKRALEEGARLKEVERQRKRNEDDKRERDRVAKIESERLEREKGESEDKKKQEEVYERVRIKEEDAKRVADERERAAAVQQAREAKRVNDVLQIVKTNEEGRDNGVAGTAAKKGTPATSQVDVIMADVLAPSASTPVVNGSGFIPKPATFVAPTVPISVAGDAKVATIQITSSVEPEDDEMMAPIRHKSSGIEKKRKRGTILDSDASDSDADDQPLAQKPRKSDEGSRDSATPAPSSLLNLPSTSATAQSLTVSLTPKDPFVGLTNIQRKLKDENFIKHSIPIKPPAPGTATAFYLPSHSLVPPAPVSVAPIPTPKKQSEVSEDFSKAKPGVQIAHHTFHTWAEAYLRPFGEDDLAFLAPKPDDVSAYLIPALGKHYLDRWDDEESDGPIASTSYASSLELPPVPRLRPDALTEDALGMENVFMGPLSERLIAALAFEEGGEQEELKEMPMETDELVLATKHQQLDAHDLEERVKRELMFIGILPEDDIEWGSREDDEVSAALRACQRLLQDQTAKNEVRKAILSSVVKDRMAFQDYETTRDAQERVIENGWTKRQRAGKKKGKGKGDKDKPSEGPKPPVTLALLSAVEKRHRLVSQFKPFFDEEEDKGRFFGIPESSVYEGMGLEEEAEDALWE